jgi:DNA-binding LacI/PurR family transcriptional regulator
VVGFDDIEMAAWTDPPLTTIRQPIGEMGRLAVDWLASALTRSQAATQAAIARHLEPALIIRGSTAPPPG